MGAAQLADEEEEEEAKAAASAGDGGDAMDETEAAAVPSEQARTRCGSSGSSLLPSALSRQDAHMNVQKARTGSASAANTAPVVAVCSL